MNIENLIFVSNGKIINLHIYGDGEHIGSVIKRERCFYENRALQTVREKVPMYGRTVIDIGANVGNHSVFFSTVCGAKVIAIEPNANNYALLEMNSANRDIVPMCMLIGNDGYYSTSEDNLANMGTITYSKTDIGERAVPIDTLGFGDVAFIKIDVEGMEYEVLLGALETIDKYKPAIMIEVEKNGEEIRKLLRDFGYDFIELKTFSKTILAVHNGN